MKVSACSYRPILLPCELKKLEYQVDPYIGCEHNCHYCYVLNRAETDWAKEIRIPRDIRSQLNEELEGVPPQKIYMGYYSDPYQPSEAEYRQTREVLELLAEKGFSVSILTKSDLFVRDMDLLTEMDDASVGISVAFNSDPVRQLFEQNTIETERRVEALKKVKDAGVKTSALICPVIPYITDVAPLIETLTPVVDTIWIYGLSMSHRSDQSWINIDGILSRNFHDKRSRIGETVFSRSHPYWTELRTKLQAIGKDSGLNLQIHV